MKNMMMNWWRYGQVHLFLFGGSYLSTINFFSSGSYGWAIFGIIVCVLLYHQWAKNFEKLMREKHETMSG